MEGEGRHGGRGDGASWGATAAAIADANDVGENVCCPTSPVGAASGCARRLPASAGWGTPPPAGYWSAAAAVVPVVVDARGGGGGVERGNASTATKQTRLAAAAVSASGGNTEAARLGDDGSGSSGSGSGADS